MGMSRIFFEVIQKGANVSCGVSIEGAPVRVLAAERTFWEKAKILHMIRNHP